MRCADHTSSGAQVAITANQLRGKHDRIGGPHVLFINYQGEVMDPRRVRSCARRRLAAALRHGEPSRRQRGGASFPGTHSLFRRCRQIDGVRHLRGTFQQVKLHFQQALPREPRMRHWHAIRTERNASARSAVPQLLGSPASGCYNPRRWLSHPRMESHLSPCAARGASFCRDRSPMDDNGGWDECVGRLN